MIRTLVAYSLFLASACGLATLYWWWKHTTKFERAIMLAGIGGTSFFGYAMLL